MINEEKAMINKNDVLILKCIMALNNCDMVSAIKFAGHNQTCYKIAMAVANAKDDENQAERQALIDKSCEWLRNNSYMLDDWDEDKCWVAFEFTSKDEMIKDFRKAMKGGEE